MNTQYIPLYI